VARIRRIFITGLLALLPLLVTLFVLGFTLSLLNTYLGPGSWVGRLLQSLGVGVGAGSTAPYVIGLLVLAGAIFGLGLVVESRLGVWSMSLLDRLMRRIPVVSSIYDMSRRFTSLVDAKGGDLKSMQPVWCFFGGEPGAAVLALLPSSTPVVISGEPYLGILVPSAPVPIGGALIYVPSAWVKPAEGGVDQLMSVYVSMGVTPPTTDAAAGASAKSI
jgi:uncharacterized membrane protein